MLKFVLTHSKSMVTLQELFKEAFRLWHEKSPDESPKHCSPTYDHFEKLRKELETQAIKLGFGGLKVKARVGMGRWAEIPWIGMRNFDLTDSFEEGEYVVYLFAPDYDTLYLGLIQGVTLLTPQELAEKTPRLRKEIVKPDGFSAGIDGKLSNHEYLTVNLTSMSEVYFIQRSIICMRRWMKRTF